MKLKSRLIIMLDRLRVGFPVKLKAGKFSVRIHEKHRPLIKWIKYVLAAIGLLTSFISFVTILVSFLVSLGLFLIGWIIERVGFQYFTLYVPPIQEKEFDLEKWTGVGFGFAETQGTNDNIPLVSFIFSDSETAKTIHEMLLLWSSGQTNDDEKKIGFSVVIDTKQKLYCCLLFPGLERSGMKSLAAAAEAERKSKKETFDDVHFPMILLQYTRKCLILQDESYLPTFRRRLPEDCPILLTFSLDTGNPRGPTPIDSLTPIMIHSFKIRDKRNLTRKDVEHRLMKLS